MSEVQLHLGDCLEFMKSMPDKSVDAVITSPPYDSLREYGGHPWDFEATAGELYRLLAIGGVVVWVVADETKDGSESGTSFRQALYFKSIGFRLHDTMIYQRSSPPLTHRRYEQHFEYMFVLSKESPKTFNPIMAKKDWMDSRSRKSIRRERDGSYDYGFAGRSDSKIIGNVWKINAGGGHSATDKYAHAHPAIFPERLARDHIVSWTNEGDIVFDCFMGSGTTGKMCVQTGRNFIGCEIDPGYFEIAKKRIAEAQLQVRMPI